MRLNTEAQSWCYDHGVEREMHADEVSVSAPWSGSTQRACQACWSDHAAPYICNTCNTPDGCSRCTGCLWSRVYPDNEVSARIQRAFSSSSQGRFILTIQHTPAVAQKRKDMRQNYQDHVAYSCCRAMLELHHGSDYKAEVCERMTVPSLMKCLRLCMACSG